MENSFSDQELLSNLMFEESFLNGNPVEFTFFYYINRLSILELDPTYYIGKQFESSNYMLAIFLYSLNCNLC